MFNLDYLFCHVDDFCQEFEPIWQQQQLSEGTITITRRRAKSLCLSEIMTTLIAFHHNHYRNFKHFYLDHIPQYWSCAFPQLPSYSRFVQLTPSTVIPLCVYLKRCFGNCTGINFIDSTKVQVCHNRRISRHRVFLNLAARGKTSVDWFFGFKLHLVVNELGEIVNMTVTAGNVDDRKPVVGLVKNLFGKVFADRGYVSGKLATKLLHDYGIEFFAKPRRNMKNQLMKFDDKILSRQRSIIETINDQLKNISQLTVRSFSKEVNS